MLGTPSPQGASAAAAWNPTTAVPPRQARVHATVRSALWWGERAFVVLGLTILSNAVTPHFYQSWGLVTDHQSVDPLTQLLIFPTYAVAMGIVLLQPRRFIQAALSSKSLWVVIGLAVASFAWSPVPDITLRRSVGLLLTTFFGVYLASRFSPRELLQLFAWTFGLAVVLSFYFALVPPRPGIATWPHEGAWVGVYGHKNTLGYIMVVSTIVFLLVHAGSAKLRVMKWMGAALSALLVILSASKTSLVVLLTLLPLLLVFRTLRLRLNVLIPLTILVMVTGASSALWFALNVEQIVTILGKDLTLTGRTEIWPPLIDLIRERPWLGYGFSGFWLGWGSEAGRLWQFLGWTPRHAHNGLLELMLIFGVVGTTVFLFNLGTAFVGGVAEIRSTNTAEGLWPLAFLCGMVLQNVTENAVLAQHNMIWVLYVATVISVMSHRRSPVPQGTPARVHPFRSPSGNTAGAVHALHWPQRSDA